MTYSLARVNTITICMQILNTSKKLLEKENNPEEEVIESETDLEERSQYEIDNDAKRYRNKIVLHDTVLVSSSVIHIMRGSYYCHICRTGWKAKTSGWRCCTDWPIMV